MTTTVEQSLTRKSVSNRLEVLSAIQRNSEVANGGIDNLRKLYKTRRLITETYNRYPQEQTEAKSIIIDESGLSWAQITQNGKYSLD